jgi:hypothetical protein
MFTFPFSSYVWLKQHCPWEIIHKYIVGETTSIRKDLPELFHMPRGWRLLLKMRQQIVLCSLKSLSSSPDLTDITYHNFLPSALTYFCRENKAKQHKKLCFLLTMNHITQVSANSVSNLLFFPCKRPSNWVTKFNMCVGVWGTRRLNTRYVTLYPEVLMP